MEEEYTHQTDRSLVTIKECDPIVLDIWLQHQERGMEQLGI